LPVVITTQVRSTEQEAGLRLNTVACKTGSRGGDEHRMLMLALARAENMVAATPLRLAICWPTAARMQHSLIFSTLLMRPALMASLNLRFGG